MIHSYIAVMTLAILLRPTDVAALLAGDDCQADAAGLAR
jgi:hypothetical protein